MSDDKPSIREQQTSLTRDRIMRGLAEVLLEVGPHQVSIQKVADRAGVSHRTVYRHFDTKDELFRSYGAWIDGQTSDDGSTVPDSVEELQRRIPEVYERFDELGEVMDAYVQLGRSGRDIEKRRRRTEALGELVRSMAPDLDDSHRSALAALVRQLACSEAWLRGKREYDVDGETLGEVANWMIEIVRRAIDEDRVPDDWSTDDEE